MVANAARTVEQINIEIEGATKLQEVKLAELSALASQSQIASSAIDARLRECESSHQANVTTISTVLGSLVPSMLVLIGFFPTLVLLTREIILN
jgi:hypothetical protein